MHIPKEFFLYTIYVSDSILEILDPFDVLVLQIISYIFPVCRYCYSMIFQQSCLFFQVEAVIHFEDDTEELQLWDQQVSNDIAGYTIPIQNTGDNFINKKNLFLCHWTKSQESPFPSSITYQQHDIMTTLSENGRMCFYFSVSVCLEP